MPAISAFEGLRIPKHAILEVAVACFAMAWLEPGEKLGVLADHVKRISKRMFEVPDFFFHAIADGVSELFTRHGRWHGLDGPEPGTGPVANGDRAPSNVSARFSLASPISEWG